MQSANHAPSTASERRPKNAAMFIREAYWQNEQAAKTIATRDATLAHTAVHSDVRRVAFPIGNESTTRCGSARSSRGGREVPARRRDREKDVATFVDGGHSLVFLE